LEEDGRKLEKMEEEKQEYKGEKIEE